MAERPRANGGFYSDKTGVKFDDFTANRGDAKDPSVPRFSGAVDMAIVSGKLVVTGTTRGGVAIADNSNGGQYRIQAVVDRNGGNADIWFHYTDPNNAYRLRYATNLEQMTLQRVENGEWTTEGTYYFEPAVDDNVSFFIEFNNNYPSANIKIYVAGTLRLDETVAFEQLSGSVALGGDQAKFDNIKVGYDNNNDHDLDDVGDSLMVNETFDSTDTTIVYDKAGNLIDDGSLQYVYDAWNRLVTVRSAKTGNATIQTAEFDGLGRRIKKVVTNSGEHDGTTVFYYDQNRNIIETRNGSGSMIMQGIPASGTVQCLGVYTALILVSNPQHLCVDPSVCLPPLFTIFHDAHGDPLGLTDLGGNVIERYNYSPYGGVTAHQESAHGDYDGDCDVDGNDRNAITGSCNGANPTGACRILDLDGDKDVDTTDQTIFDTLPQGLARHPGRSFSGVGNAILFQSLWFDAEIGSYQNHLRQFDPEKGRFIQPDPYSTATRAGLAYGDGSSRYTYVRANPIRFRDPSGAFVSDLTWFQGMGQVDVDIDLVIWGINAGAAKIAAEIEMQTWNQGGVGCVTHTDPESPGQIIARFHSSIIVDNGLTDADGRCCATAPGAPGCPHTGPGEGGPCADLANTHHPTRVSVWVGPPTTPAYQSGSDWLGSLQQACVPHDWIGSSFPMVAHEVGHCMGGIHPGIGITTSTDEPGPAHGLHIIHQGPAMNAYAAPHNIVDVLNRHSRLSGIHPPADQLRYQAGDPWDCCGASCVGP